MQQTTYNLKRIEPDDPFSPDTLNANTDAVAAQLARVDAALSAEADARESADAAEKSARETADAAKAPQTEIARLESAAATEKARVNGEISRIDTALAAKAAQTALTSLTQTVAANKTAADTALAAKAEKTALTAEETARKSDVARLQTAIGAGGGTARMVYGSYTGNGTSGKTNPNKLDFAATLGKAPKLLIVADSQSQYQAVIVNGAHSAETRDSSNYDFRCFLTWTATGVEWYSTQDPVYQLNAQHKYYYVAFA